MEGASISWHEVKFGSNHYATGDTYLHSWEVLAQILEHDECQDILLDIGMSASPGSLSIFIYEANYSRKLKGPSPTAAADITAVSSFSIRRSS